MKKKRSKHSSNTIIYLFFLLLLLLATVAVIQQSTEVRQFAQTATPTPMLRCGVVCTYNSQCPTGLFCSNGLCRNPMCPLQGDCTCSITPTPNPYVPPQVVSTNTPIPSITALPTVYPTYAYVSPTFYPASNSIVSTSGGLVPTPTPDFAVTEAPK